jgi:hypothetical protein
MLLLRVAEQNSLEGDSLKVGMKGGVRTMASFQAPCFVQIIEEDVAVEIGQNYGGMCQVCIVMLINSAR